MDGTFLTGNQSSLSLLSVCLKDHPVANLVAESLGTMLGCGEKSPIGVWGNSGQKAGLVRTKRNRIQGADDYATELWVYQEAWSSSDTLRIVVSKTTAGGDAASSSRMGGKVAAWCRFFCSKAALHAHVTYKTWSMALGDLKAGA